MLVLKTAFFHIMYYATVGIFTACKLAFYVSLFPVFYAFHYDIRIWLGQWKYLFYISLNCLIILPMYDIDSKTIFIQLKTLKVFLILFLWYYVEVFPHKISIKHSHEYKFGDQWNWGSCWGIFWKWLYSKYYVNSLKTISIRYNHF